jgi:hypothetical protein
MTTAQRNCFHYTVSKDTVIGIRNSNNRAGQSVARKLHILGVAMHLCIPYAIKE